MPVQSSDLTVGPTDIYWALFTDATATEPTSPETAPAASWVYVGATDGGVTLSIAQTYQAQYVDQVADAMASSLDTREFQAEFSLTRVTLENLKTFLNGGTITTSGTGATQTKKFEPVVDLVANDPIYFKLLFRGKAPDSEDGFSGQKRDVVLRKVLQVNDLGYNTGKVDKSVFTVSVRSHFVSNSVAPFMWNDMDEATV